MNNILEFKKRLRENEAVKAFNNEEGTASAILAIEGLYRTSSFYMTCKFGGIMTKHLTLIDLDDEDLEYFKKKYLTEESLKEEMNAEIESIKKKYL